MPFNKVIDQYFEDTLVVDTEMNKRQQKLLENDLELALNRGYETSKAIPNVSLNTIQENGIYTVDSTNTDKPVGISYGSMLVMKRGADRFSQILVNNITDSDIYLRSYISSGWTEWQKLAYTKTHTPTLLNGWKVYVGSLSIVRNGNYVNFPNVRLNSGVTTQATTLFTLPVGFRPKETTDMLCRIGVFDSGRVTNIRVYTDGNVKILYTNVQTNDEIVFLGGGYYAD